MTFIQQLYLWLFISPCTFLVYCFEKVCWLVTIYLEPVTWLLPPAPVWASGQFLYMHTPSLLYKLYIIYNTVHAVILNIQKCSCIFIRPLPIVVFVPINICICIRQLNTVSCKIQGGGGFLGKSMMGRDFPAIFTRYT